MSGKKRPGMMAQPQLNRYVEVNHQRYITVRITWIHGGTNVYIAGSWNNWEREDLSEHNFIIEKTLPINNIYYYYFIVDGCWKHAPEYPSGFLDSGLGYNILDLQVPMSGMQRPGMMAQPQLNRYVEVNHQRYKTVRITWIHGGTKVYISGSWNNNWEWEALQNVSEHNFVIEKTLPVNIYYYHFIVDGCWKHAPEYPSGSLDSGLGYNILDLQDYIPQRAENEVEDPPSPVSSYDNRPLNEYDFICSPPNLPPQIPEILTERASTSNTAPVPSFTHTQLNHLYWWSPGDRLLELRSTQRFRHKFVTSVLYKSLPKKKT